MSLLLGLRRLCTTSTSTGNALYDVVIVGSGMVGGALSCSLGQEPILADKRILVLEASAKQPNMLTKDEQYSTRVVNLNIGSVELLNNLGVWDDIAAVRVRAFDHMHVWDSCADSSVSFDPTQSTSIGYIVENDLITAALSNRTRACRNVEVCYGKEVIGLGRSSEAWRNVTLQDGSEIKTKLLVAADGKYSNIRKLAGMNSIGWNYDQSAVVARLDLAEVTRGNRTAWQRFLPTGPIALLPLTDDSSSLVWSTTKEHAKKLTSLAEEDFVTAVNAALFNYYPRSQLVDFYTSGVNQFISGLQFSHSNSLVHPPQVSGVVMDTVASFPLSFNHSVRYVQDGLVLIGDAAHTVHPLAGLGVNLGFGDVVTLTEVLKSTVAMGADIGSPSHLLRYETARQRHNLPIMAFVDLTKRIYSTSSTIPIILRASLTQLVQSVKPIKELLTNQAERI